MDIRVTIIISIAVLLFTMYYLEKELKKEQIFWGYAMLGVLFGLTSVFSVAKHSPSSSYYITFTVLFILIAILYYESEEERVEIKKKVPKKKKPKKKKIAAKELKAERESYQTLLSKLEDSFREGDISKSVYEKQKAEYLKKLEELESR